MSIKKYRPYLTLEELKFLQLASTKHPSLHSYLFTYINQIEAGIRQANLQTQPKASLEQKLGFAETPQPAKEEHGRPMDVLLDLYMNVETPWFTPAERERLNNHLYLNDLMTEEEKEAYEKAHGLCF